MSASLAEQTRTERMKRLERRVENLRAERDRMAHRAEKAIATRKEAEERAEGSYEAATEAMKVLNEILMDDEREGLTGDHLKRFFNLWQRLNELSTASSWVEDTPGIEER